MEDLLRHGALALLAGEPTGEEVSRSTDHCANLTENEL